MVKSIFKSNENYNSNIINYPYNSLSSIVYLIPILILKEDIYGKLILLSLSISSILWWGKSKKSIRYWDTNSVIGVELWILSILLNNYKLNRLLIGVLCIKNEIIIKYIIVILSIFIIILNSNIIINSIYILSLISKLSDTFYGYKYGTCLFHLLSGVSILIFVN